MDTQMIICERKIYVIPGTLTTDTPVSCDKRFRDFWGVCSNLSPISSNVSFCKNMTLTVDFSILYGACFFESFSLSPNCAGIRHRSSWKLYLKSASCFRKTTSCFSYTYCE